MSTVTVYEEEDPGEEGKVCCLCSRMLPYWEFYDVLRKGESPTVTSRCKDCLRAHFRKHTFKLTDEELVQVQATEYCDICQSPLTNGKSQYGRALDHDHESGVVRGVLCGGCNRGLGCAKDSPELLRAMADYLEAHHGR